MRRKDLVPQGTLLWVAYPDEKPPCITQNYFHSVAGDRAVMFHAASGITVTAPLDHCFFTWAGAYACIKDRVGGGRA